MFDRLSIPGQEQAGRRRCSYIDGRIQGWLVAAIVLFEMLLILIGMLFLYYDLNHLIESQVFLVHPAGQEGSSVLVKHLIMVVAVIIVANIVLVALIEYVWSGYIAKIIWPLRQALQAVISLDLRNRPAPAVLQHEVLEKAGEWFRCERLRYFQLRQLAQKLDVGMEASEAKTLLSKMRLCLPERIQ